MCFKSITLLEKFVILNSDISFTFTYFAEAFIRCDFHYIRFTSVFALQRKEVRKWAHHTRIRERMEYERTIVTDTHGENVQLKSVCAAAVGLRQEGVFQDHVSPGLFSRNRGSIYHQLVLLSTGFDWAALDVSDYGWIIWVNEAFISERDCVIWRK